MERLPPQIDAAIAACEAGGVFPHTLLYGPAGCGKTTTARAIAARLGRRFIEIDGRGLSPDRLDSIMPTINMGDILFIDEIHGLLPRVEDAIVVAMESRLYHGRLASIGLPAFTVIGATTEKWRLSKPLASRFVLSVFIDYYRLGEMKKIVAALAAQRGIALDEQAIALIASTAWGVPRRARNMIDALVLYRRSRNIRAGVIALEEASAALRLFGYRTGGLSDEHVKVLDALATHGTLGAQTLAGFAGLPIEDLWEVEQELLRLRLIRITARGREITENGRRALALAMK